MIESICYLNDMNDNICQFQETFKYAFFFLLTSYFYLCQIFDSIWFDSVFRWLPPQAIGWGNSLHSHIQSLFVTWICLQKLRLKHAIWHWFEFRWFPISHPTKWKKTQTHNIQIYTTYKCIYVNIESSFGFFLLLLFSNAEYGSVSFSPLRIYNWLS